MTAAQSWTLVVGSPGVTVAMHALQRRVLCAEVDRMAERIRVEGRRVPWRAARRRRAGRRDARRTPDAGRRLGRLEG